MSHLVAAEERPLRADARRNREKVLEAARFVFSENGRDAQMDDVARRAGVGVGTVYRHFPTKEALIEALMLAAFRSIADEAERALHEIADPWEAFATVLWHGAEVMSADRAMSEVFASIPGVAESAIPTIDALKATMDELIDHAKAAGALRADLIGDDIPMIMCGIGAATKKEHRCPGAWRRHLSIVLDGLRAQAASSKLPE
jgi:AcrR family transcriptional regulator